MNTMFLLMAEYETPAVPLSEICEKYLGMKPSTAESKAALGQLALPTFRIGESQKSPRLVHLQDLAELIDLKRKEANCCIQLPDCVLRRGLSRLKQKKEIPERVSGHFFTISNRNDPLRHWIVNF